MKNMFANKEYLVIVVAWMIIYAMAPLYIWYADTLNGFEFNIGRMFGMWMTTTMFLLLYIIHHFILVPRFFVAKRYAVYAAALCICMSLFTYGLVCHSPKPFGHKAHRVGQSMHHHARWKEKGAEQRDIHRNHRNMLSPPDVACIIMALLMLGADIGIIAWMNSQKLRSRLLLLEKQSLKQELEHLRYQINPHFFMNTLNNIHVLVDVDQERAKRAIIELSGLMRHSLYNGHESVTPLQNEVEFLRQYISLMQLRFGSRVSLHTNLPDVPSRDILLPPLLFATFVENAFKHGISYQKPSFVNVCLTVDSDNSKIHFRCENSRNETSATQDGYHGIGLNNVRKRLDLQYTGNYTLDIKDDDPGKFVVDLILPIQIPG